MGDDAQAATNQTRELPPILKDIRGYKYEFKGGSARGWAVGLFDAGEKADGGMVFGERKRGGWK